MASEQPTARPAKSGQIGWERKRVLIAVRTYPTPAQNGIEVSCTAGVTDNGQWIRLFPIPYRFLDSDRRFSKWQWIDVDVQHSNDPRPESYRIDPESIEVISAIPPKRTWDGRKKFIEPMRSGSLCELQQVQRHDKTANTLGFFRPKIIHQLKLDAESSEWTAGQLSRLRQLPLFGNAPMSELEKLPYKFSYEFECDDASCSGHVLSCTDWEMGQAYRRFGWRYKSGWEAKFRQKFEQEMIDRFDTSFFVGTMRAHPNSWIIVGLWYPLPI